MEENHQFDVSVDEASELFENLSVLEKNHSLLTSPEENIAISDKMESFPPFVESNATEIVFYDLETTVPCIDVIEFGAIVVDKQTLVIKDRYETLIQSNRVTKRSISFNGITNEMLMEAPNFIDVADRIFSLMDGRIWAGHNIIAFDNKHLRKRFRLEGLNEPRTMGVIDTYVLLRKSSFGKRAGNFKMNSLMKFFHLGEEKHRALDDALMTLEVFKNCCTIMFLEEKVRANNEEVNSNRRKNLSITNSCSTTVKNVLEEKCVKEEYSIETNPDIQTQQKHSLSSQSIPLTTTPPSTTASSPFSKRSDIVLQPSSRKDNCSIWFSPFQSPFSLDTEKDANTLIIQPDNNDVADISSRTSNSSGSDKTNFTMSPNLQLSIQDIIELVDDAIQQRKEIWIVYIKGSARPAQPNKWITKPEKFLAFCKVSNSQKYFLTKKIVGIQNRESY